MKDTFECDGYEVRVNATPEYVSFVPTFGWAFSATKEGSPSFVVVINSTSYVTDENKALARNLGEQVVCSRVRNGRLEDGGKYCYEWTGH